jgi:NAD(P)H-dependent FMN reductase
MKGKDMALKLKIIIGSTRPGRMGPAIARWVEGVATSHGKFEVELVDLAEVGLPLLDEANHPSRRDYANDHTKRWAAIVGEADAFVFVTPEYDFFPPATIVNAVQYLLHEWAKKPAAVVSYGGVSGGLRASQVLRGLLGNVGMVAIPQSVPIPFFPKFLDEDGTFAPNEQMAEGAGIVMDQLHDWAVGLKGMREA